MTRRTAQVLPSKPLLAFLLRSEACESDGTFLQHRIAEPFLRDEQIRPKQMPGMRAFG